ncbi:Uncharacterised protein [Mycobacteroides abscessus subsp. abscessus]|nr:Uncharacterised protein [Mycobacteroides abscessus subsp. abscessus]
MAFAAGPARLTMVRCRLVMPAVCTYTAPPGSPIPPRAMNTNGSAMDSTGSVYCSGFNVR